MKDEISRRTALSLGGVAALGLALPATLLTAQTPRRKPSGWTVSGSAAGRRDRRDARRTGRQDRRDVRRGNTPATTTPAPDRQRRHGTEIGAARFP